MEKRTFLKNLLLFAGGAAFSRFAACTPPQPMEEPLMNWAGNLTYSTTNVHRAQSLEGLQQFVRDHSRLRGLGSRHSFNSIADSRDNLVSMTGMNKILSLDEEAGTIEVEAGIKYGDLCAYLDERGFALHNLASLPHISIAGACATATHGSGLGNGNLATQVAALEFVDASGHPQRLSRDRDGEQFHGAVVGLGALGLVTKVTLNLVPAFRVQQAVYLDLPMTELASNFEAIMGSGYSVSLFTDWRTDKVNQVWIKRRVEEGEPYTFPDTFYGARLATEDVHPVITESAVNCTEQRGVPGPWYDRLPHFKMGFKPSAGEELQSEYFVPLEHGYEGMQAMAELGTRISSHLFISEIRSIAADQLWMSPCYRQPSVALHTTWKQDWPAVQQLLPHIEERLTPFNVRPHWGKLFTIDPAVLQARYEKLDDFRALVAEYDPEGKFRNDFLDKYVF